MKCSWFQTCSNSLASFTASSGNQFVLHHVLEDIWVFVIEYVMLVNMPDTSNLAEPKLLNSTLMSGCSWLWYRLYVYTHIATIYILIWTHFLRDTFVESITLWFQWVPLFPIKTISEGLCFCPQPSHLQLFLEPFGLLRPFWWINTSGIPCA